MFTSLIWKSFRVMIPVVKTAAGTAQAAMDADLRNLRRRLSKAGIRPERKTSGAVQRHNKLSVSSDAPRESSIHLRAGDFGAGPRASLPSPNDSNRTAMDNQRLTRFETPSLRSTKYCAKTLTTQMAVLIGSGNQLGP